MTFTELQKRRIRESFEQVRDIAAPLASLFYGRLFATDPSTRPLFKNDIKAQGAKLMDMLAAVVDSLDRFDRLTPILRELGHRHAVYGVTDAQYHSVSAALQWALAQALEAQFDSETRAAWAALLDAVSSEMIAGAAEPVHKS
jgi:hemoglobin-like flavoprotein